MTSKYQRRFPEEFKAEAVRMYLDDPSVTYAQVGKNLGVTSETVRTWVKKHRKQQGESLISTGGLGRTRAESLGRSTGGETSMDADRRKVGSQCSGGKFGSRSVWLDPCRGGFGRKVWDASDLGELKDLAVLGSAP